MESQGTLNRQNNLEKEEQSWKFYISRFQNLLQSNQKQFGTGIRIDITTNGLEQRAPK